MLWDEMTGEQREQKRQEVAKRRWDYTRNEAKYDVLIMALHSFDNHAIVGALLEALGDDNVAEIVHELQENPAIADELRARFEAGQFLNEALLRMDERPKSHCLPRRLRF
jgi:hypothetical protein